MLPSIIAAAGAHAKDLINCSKQISFIIVISTGEYLANSISRFKVAKISPGTVAGYQTANLNYNWREICIIGKCPKI